MYGKQHFSSGTSFNVINPILRKFTLNMSLNQVDQFLFLKIVGELPATNNLIPFLLINLTMGYQLIYPVKFQSKSFPFHDILYLLYK